MCGNVLWTEKYKPDIDDFVQDDVQSELFSIGSTGMNAIISGEVGVGKTAGSKAIAKYEHDNWNQDTDIINISDIFNKNKKEIKNHPKYYRFLEGKSRLSKRDMINHILKEIANHPPVTGGYKTVILDNAEDTRYDFQQSLRRTMERHANNIQFIFTTRKTNSLTPAIQSRCYPLHIRPPDDSEAYEILENICVNKSVEYDESGLRYIWSVSKPNVRLSIIRLQTTESESEQITPQNVKETLKDSGDREKFDEIFSKAKDGNYSEVNKLINDLIYEAGYSPDDLLSELVEQAVYNLESRESKLFCEFAGKSSYDISNSNDATVHLSSLISRWGEKI